MATLDGQVGVESRRNTVEISVSDYLTSLSAFRKAVTTKVVEEKLKWGDS
ncbi:MAG: hypothetical protein U0231_16410 [Nitrospiraceae bacterium]